MKHFLFPLFLMCSLYCTAQTPYNLEAAKVLAKSSNKLILIDFTATWCGPCTMMDMQFWSKDEYQNTIRKFIVVKIDIDRYKSTAMHYNIEAIPAIKIVDAQGDEICDFVGYDGAENMEKQLAGFPASVGDLYEATNFQKKDTPTAEECLFAASSYQTLAQALTDLPKDAFLKQSNKYFKKCTKINPLDSLAQKAIIGRAFNYLLEEDPQKAAGEIHIDKIYEDNKAFALYILARAYRDMKDKMNAEKYLLMLEALKDDYWQTAVASIRKSLE